MQAASDGEPALPGAQRRGREVRLGGGVQSGASRRRRAGRPGCVVGPALAGWLRRKSGPTSGWQRGWCVLAGRQITWFDEKGGVRQFTLELAGCVCKRSQAPTAREGTELELATPDRTYRLDTETVEQAGRWLAALCEATGTEATPPAEVTPPGASAVDAGSECVTQVEASGAGDILPASAAVDARSKSTTQLVQRSQSAKQDLHPRHDVFAVVVDELALRNQPSLRGSAVADKAFRGDRLHAKSIREGWICLDNDTWAEMNHGKQTCIVPESGLSEFLQRYPNALRPRQATTISVRPGQFEGWMMKKGEVRQNWKCRYFVLTTSGSGSKLRYYEEGSANETPRAHLGTIDFAHCCSVSSPGDGCIELTVRRVHNKKQPARKKAAGQEPETSTRTFELIPVPSKVAHVSSGRPCLDPTEERLELAERWLQACSAAAPQI